MTKRWKAAWLNRRTAIIMPVAASVMGIAWYHNETAKMNRRIEATLPLPGDVNGDGRVELDDILLVMHAFSSPDDCAPPCPEDICRCGPHVVDLDDLLAVLAASSGESVICPSPAARIYVECEDADGVLVPVERNEDGGIAVLEGQRCVYSAVPAAEPGD